MIIVYDVSSNSLKITYEQDDKLITIQELRDNPTEKYKPGLSSINFSDLFNLINIDGYYEEKCFKFFGLCKEDLKLMNNYGRENSNTWTWSFDLGYVTILKDTKVFLVTVKHSSGSYLQYLFIGDKPLIKKVSRTGLDLRELQEFVYEDNSLEVKLFISPNLSQPLLISSWSEDNNIYFRNSLLFRIFEGVLTKLGDSSVNILNRFLLFLEYFDNNTESGSEIIDLEEYYDLIKLTYNKIY